MVIIPLIKTADWRRRDFLVNAQCVVFEPRNSEFRRRNLCLLLDMLPSASSMLDEMKLNSLVWCIIHPNAVLGAVWVGLLEEPFTMDGFGVVFLELFHILGSS